MDLVFSTQPIDDQGRIGFDDGRDVIEDRSFAAFERTIRQLADEGLDCLDVTVSIDTVECPACEGSGGLAWDRTGGMARSCHYCDESGLVKPTELPAIQARLNEQLSREIRQQAELDALLRETEYEVK